MKHIAFVSLLALFATGCQMMSAPLEATGGEHEVHGTNESTSSSDFGSESYVWEEMEFPANKTEK